MTQVSSTQELQKKHGSVAAHGSAIINSLPGRGHVIICEAGNVEPGRRRDDRLVTLEQAEQPSLQRLGASTVRIAYREGDCESARAALVAGAIAPGEPVAADAGTIAMLNLAERVGKSDIPVLIQGPTGTGKEVLARFIHNASDRANEAFVAINCAAMPEAMLEALLFGHRKGAFTGASEAGEGFFRAANNGTLLLDELGEMPLGLQAKLLRALQEGEVVPLGATQPVPVDVRIIACTNRDLASEIAAGRFREDLYFRLNVFPLSLSALCERRDDIAPLAYTMLMRHAPDPENIAWLSAEALDMLKRHPWPGNVRELENVIRRAVLLADGAPIIDASAIVFDQTARAVEPAHGVFHATSPSQARAVDDNLSAIVRRSEAQAILDTLDDNSGNRLATARALGISERTLRYRIASMREAGLMAAGGAR